MKLIRDVSDFPAEHHGGSLSIGNFDGVHEGHAVIARRLREMTVRHGGSSIVVTFDPHPLRVLRPDHAPTPLTWIERRAALLGELGVDVVVVLRSDKNLLDLTAEEFFRRVILDQLRASAIVEGANFRFGKHRKGDVALLRELCTMCSIDLDVVEPVPSPDDGQVISSSRARRLILEGRVAEAGDLLKRPHRIRGCVARGAGRGASLGFPTANLEQIDVLVPSGGVYAGLCRVDGAISPVALHVGPNPTFGEGEHKVEAHVLDYAGDLYGQMLEIDILERVRSTTKFESPEAMRETLHRDVRTCRDIGTRAIKSLI